MPASTPFYPAFGHKPEQLIGREQAVSDFLSSLSSPPGHRTRALLVAGNRGMGKTALLAEYCEWAKAQGFEVLQMAPDEDWSAVLLQQAAQKKVFVAIDGVQSITSSLRSVGGIYRRLAAQGRDVVLCITGTPNALQSLESDSVLGFLSRARRIRCKALPLGKVQGAFGRALSRAGASPSLELLEQAASSTQGHPYLMQLVGSHLLAQCSENTLTKKQVEDAIAYANADFASEVLRPLLANLSPRDMDFLKAMAVLEKPVSIASLRAKMNVADNYLQPYRARLIGAGVIVSPRRGQLDFALPGLRELLS